MSAIDHLLTVSQEYARATGLEVKTVSWRLFDDNKKLDAIIGGSDIQVRRLEKAMQWLSENWPAGAVWPEGVPRPQAAEASR